MYASVWWLMLGLDENFQRWGRGGSILWHGPWARSTLPLPFQYSCGLCPIYYLLFVGVYVGSLILSQMDFCFYKGDKTPQTRTDYANLSACSLPWITE